MSVSEKTLKKELDKLAEAILRYNLFREKHTTERGKQ